MTKIIIQSILTILGIALLIKFYALFISFLFLIGEIWANYGLAVIATIFTFFFIGVFYEQNKNKKSCDELKT